MSRAPLFALLFVPLALACSASKGSIDGDTTDGSNGADDSGGSDGSGGDDSSDDTNCDLTGQAFLIDFANSNIIDPPNIGALLIAQLNGDVLLQVQAQGADSIDAMIGFSNEGVQDECVATADLPTSDWNDPEMELGPQDITLNLAGSPVPLSSFHLSISVNEDCESLEAGVATGELDARPLNDVVGSVFGTDDADELCETLAGLGVTCGACSSDGELYCSPLLIEDLGGPAVDNVLVETTEDDVAANPACE